MSILSSVHFTSLRFTSLQRRKHTNLQRATDHVLGFSRTSEGPALVQLPTGRAKVPANVPERPVEHHIRRTNGVVFGATRDEDA